MVKDTYIIGVYPPPFGGVTVKCSLFSTLLENSGKKLSKIDLYEINRHKVCAVPVIWRCIKAFQSHNTIIYCSDTKRLRALMTLQRLFPKSLSNTTVLAAGGTFHKIVAEHKLFGASLKKVKGIWVETEGMKEAFLEMGFSNISVFPNPKSEVGACAPVHSDPAQPLKLVFFSQVSKEKGVEDIMQMVALLEKQHVNYQLDFFGHVVPDIANQFHDFVEKHDNVAYCGVFDATKSSIYEKLNWYDLLLFPTHWNTEGVPGILVEAKMAGLAVIASDRSFNLEMVRENQNEGFIVRKNYAQEMAELVCRCAEDRNLVNHKKEGSFRSRKRYSLQEYESMIELL